METAFQADAFQNDAFQIGAPLPSGGIDDDGVVDRRRRDMIAEAIAEDDELHVLLT